MQQRILTISRSFNSVVEFNDHSDTHFYFFQVLKSISELFVLASPHEFDIEKVRIVVVDCLI